MGINPTVKYHTFIDSCKSQQLAEDAYTELHHIVPRCLGGSDDSNNLIRLTARQHWTAHWMLCRAYPDNSLLAYAFYMMSHIRRYGGHIISSRQYELLKQAHRPLRIQLGRRLSTLTHNTPWMEKRRTDALKQALTGKPLSRDHLANLATAMSKPEYREFHRQHSLRLMSDPARRAASAQAGRDYTATSEFRELARNASNHHWSNPENRKTGGEHSVRAWKNPEYRHKIEQAQRELAQTPERLKHLTNIAAERMNRPGAK